jgi:hypothetical protein
MLGLKACFRNLVSAMHHGQRFTISFPRYQQFGLKWLQIIFCKIQDRGPLKLKNNV